MKTENLDVISERIPIAKEQFSKNKYFVEGKSPKNV
jgi:hypothetical protein